MAKHGADSKPRKRKRKEKREKRRIRRGKRSEENEDNGTDSKHAKKAWVYAVQNSEKPMNARDRRGAAATIRSPTRHARRRATAANALHAVVHRVTNRIAVINSDSQGDRQTRDKETKSATDRSIGLWTSPQMGGGQAKEREREK
jgi:hypothetical protein